MIFRAAETLCKGFEHTRMVFTMNFKAFRKKSKIKEIIKRDFEKVVRAYLSISFNLQMASIDLFQGT